MNESRLRPVESDHENRMVKIYVKELKSLHVPTRCTFIFSGSVLGISWLSVLYLEKFYVGSHPSNFSKIYVSEDKAC